VTTFPLLTLLWVLPVTGAAIIIGLPASQRQAAKYADRLPQLDNLRVVSVTAKDVEVEAPGHESGASVRWLLPRLHVAPVVNAASGSA
jgi:NADH-quinone oxidoreductase subunit M